MSTILTPLWNHVHLVRRCLLSQQRILVLTSPEWAGMLPPSNAVIAETKNLIDTAAVTETLLAAVKEHFPNEIK